MTYSITQSHFIEFLSSLSDDSVDLILTDPPYAISRVTRFATGKSPNPKYARLTMDFGDWDQEEIDLEKFVELSYAKLRQGGSMICFYDLWKFNRLADLMRDNKFRIIRFIEWKKKNPVPVNSQKHYLTNSKEIAVSGVKGNNPTFHSSYDTGDYLYPIPGKTDRHHPTQKPLQLFHDLVNKHTNPGDLVVDPFLGSGTTALAAVSNGRKFSGCDINPAYVSIAEKRVDDATKQSRLIV